MAATRKKTAPRRSTTSARAPSSKAAAATAPAAGVSENLARTLRSEILKGTYAVGERLPSERELAARFDTNRNTLREAVRTLEAQGLLDVRRGDGTRVRDFRHHGDLSLLPDLLTSGAFDRMTRARALSDLLRLRRALALDLVEIAARRADQATLDALAAAVTEARAADDVATFARRDLAVMARLVAAADSIVATWICTGLLGVLERNLDAFPALHVRPEGYEDGWEAAFDALRQNLPIAARVALDGVLTRTDRAILERLRAEVAGAA
jgi:DNA-binding FadR family transcriptional regulator